MRKLVFSNLGFYYAIVSYLIIFILWNSYAVYSGNKMGLIPIAIQSVLLFLILTKKPIGKIVLKLFVIIVLIGASSLKLISAILRLLIGEFASIDENVLMLSGLKLGVGIVFLGFINKTVKIENLNETGNVPN